MPGLDQGGPEGRGPMTGRRQGNCQCAGMGRGACRRTESGRRFARRYGAGPVQDTESRASLKGRARILEDELAAVKDQLNAMSENQ